MRKAAVISEFNPFHNGHKFLLEKIKSTCADEIISVMSGSFVQRGDIAVTDKFTRAKTALEHGADLVVELPTVYAVSGAARFAQNGVRLAKALCCDTLCFGAESPLDQLNAVADALESDTVNTAVKAKMDEGLYYPKAIEAALAETAGEDAAALTRTPNNLLALEYIKSCRNNGIRPVAFERIGVSHDSDEIIGDYASGSLLRAMLKKGDDIHALSPMQIESVASLSSLESAILYRLKTMKLDEIAMLAEVDEGLEHRIKDAALHSSSLEELIESVKTKRYTRARIRRILISSLLGITKARQNSPVPYLRVLGVRNGKEDLLSHAALPLLVKLKSDLQRLDPIAADILSVDVNAAHAMNLAQHAPFDEFSQGVIKVD